MNSERRDILHTLYASTGPSQARKGVVHGTALSDFGDHWHGGSLR